MFTQKQFEFMCRAQYADDWHCSCFVDVLREYHELPEHEAYVNETRLEQTEFDELMAILLRADQQDIFELQMALNCLNLLPSQIFE
ncbi:MAG: hypothetical protein KME49_25660 [Brasilonema octagenarum HA4186-MV1]|jgi:hypothetical protein|nr:hypothetical protein [Brasilonema octagenarum HA4186-MV1]